MEIKSNQIEGTTTNWENFIKILQENNFFEIKKHMRLINSQSYEIYLPLKINKEDLKINSQDPDGRVWENYKKLCKNINNIELDGKIVWNTYKDLIRDWAIGYAEKKIKLSQLNEIIINFIVSIREKPQWDIEDSIGDIYYLKNYENFIDDENKFNIKEYCKLNKISDESDQLFY